MRLMRFWMLTICSLLLSLHAAAQEADSVGGEPPKRFAHTLTGRLHQVQQHLDSSATKKVDPHYIEVPKKPWRVILRYKQNMVDVDYTQSLYFPEYNEHSEWKLHFKPPAASSVGFWVGYRGTGLSYSWSLAKNAGRYFSFSSTGAKYGVNFRLRRFNINETSFTLHDQTEGRPDTTISLEGTMPAPVWIRSAYVNGYYVFNGHRYSQAAAYNQSVIQRRSAGSVLLGATWYQSSFDYSDEDNFFFMLIGNGTHRIKVHQANIGIGYGYNLVPLRGLVVNAMAMPTLSVYNRVKVYKYDFNVNITDEEGQADDYGQWNAETKTWANGKKYKPMLKALLAGDKIEHWELEPETAYSALHFNVDLRVGIAYNWKNYFVGAQAQFNNFAYRKDGCEVRLFDAYGQVALGMRL